MYSRQEQVSFTNVISFFFLSTLRAMNIFPTGQAGRTSVASFLMSFLLHTGVNDNIFKCTFIPVLSTQNNYKKMMFKCVSGVKTFWLFYVAS